MKHPLQTLIELTDGYKPRAYTGRGMGRRQCLGVSIEDTGEFFASILRAMVESTAEHDEMGDVAEAFDGMREDSLGKGIIVYFPDIEFDGGES